MRSLVLGAGFVAVALTLAPAASAQEAESAHATPPEAVELFRSAREHYREGRYAEAATDLERALVLDPSSPTLHYNLGRVYELLGRLEDARRTYAGYLELLGPEELEERERTEATIQRLDGAIASGAGATEPAEPAEQEPLRELSGPVLVRERGVADLAFWVTGAAGVGLLVVAAITGGVALERAGARDGLTLSAPGQLEAYESRRASLDGEARALGITTDVLFGVGAGAVIASFLLYILREHEVEREIVREEAIALAPFVSGAPGGAVLGVRGRL